MNESILIFLIILLAASVALVPITARLGLGSVIGYLFAGLALGPQGLKVMTNPEEIMHYSEFGVVLLLFIIGLELHPKRLWELRHAIFGMGTTQIAVTSALICGTLMAIGWPWGEALIAGLGVSMSSTAIAMQIIGERNLKTHSAGKNGFAVLLFQDLAFIPILFVVSFLGVKADVASGHSAAYFVGRALAAVVGIVVSVRFLSYPFFRWVTKTHIRELSIAFSLLLVLGIAYVMEHVGLSMALGTFIAGVILADSEYRHEIEANIEPFKGLLLGLFFLAVGMQIKLDLIISQPLPVCGFLLGLLLCKALALAFTALIFKTPKREIPLFTILLSQGGEFAFVLFGQGVAQSALPQDKAAILNAVVTLSMLTTPLLMLLYDKFLADLGVDGKPEADTIDNEGHPVIIAGFGRMGQVLARILKLNKFSSTVIDHNPEQIDRVRKFGFKAYYGDASQLGILESAGLANAKLLVLAIDHQETVNDIIEEVRRYYPDLPILARARDRIHAYQLMDMGVKYLERETFGSSMNMGEMALTILGVPAFKAHRMVLKFKHYDLLMMEKLYPFHNDEKGLISQSREAREAVERLFARDAENVVAKETDGWN